MGVWSEYRGNYPSLPHCLAWSIQKFIANVTAFHSNDIKPLSARIPDFQGQLPAVITSMFSELRTTRKRDCFCTRKNSPKSQSLKQANSAGEHFMWIFTKTVHPTNQSLNKNDLQEITCVNCHIGIHDYYSLLVLLIFNNKYGCYYSMFSVYILYIFWYFILPVYILCIFHLYRILF